MGKGSRRSKKKIYLSATLYHIEYPGTELVSSLWEADE